MATAYKNTKKEIVKTLIQSPCYLKLFKLKERLELVKETLRR